MFMQGKLGQASYGDIYIFCVASLVKAGTKGLVSATSPCMHQVAGQVGHFRFKI